MDPLYQDKLDRLVQEKAVLVDRFLSGKAMNFLAAHARLLDDYFQEAFLSSRVGPQLLKEKHPYAIMALGGYGRREQCIHSDVDLLVLFDKKVPPRAEELVREIVYPLWDIGMDVGHATRSIHECVQLAGEDFEILTPLLDARFICGMSPLHSRLMERLGQKLIAKHSNKIVTWLVKRNELRHDRFGDSTYLLEPNLKEGQGGLRDYHTMSWIARIKYNLKQTRDLEYLGLLSHGEFQRLTQALSFIWLVRNRLHHLTSRKSDQLRFEYQIEMANAMAMSEKKGLAPVERFLGELHSQMGFIKQQYLMFLSEHGRVRKSKILSLAAKPFTVQGLGIHNDLLSFQSPEAIVESPILLIKIFEESARLKMPLSSEGRRLVREFLGLMTYDFITSPVAVKSFEKVLTLAPRSFNVLNDMLITGFLEKWIPEMRHIVNRIQYDDYHLYPVDLHSIQTVHTIKNFGSVLDETGDSLCASFYKEIKNRKLVLWAALLHDIGKGKPGEDHSHKGAEIVRRVLTKKGFPPKQIDTIAFLVREHLLLSKTAARRDLNDEETALLCARKINDPELLKMLYLLTVADSVSTGPKAWNQWTLTLIRDLTLKVLRVLETGELASRKAVQQVENKQKELLQTADTAEARALFETLLPAMSPRYLLYTDVSEIATHIELYRQLKGAPFVWRVTAAASKEVRTVTVCAKDRPGLFSNMAGVFTLCGFDILNARVYTWRNKIALDIFEVRAPNDTEFEPERWERAATRLQAALNGELNLGVALQERMQTYQTATRQSLKRPHKVKIDNHSSSFFTIIEVFTYDFPGLLYLITHTLFQCRLDVWVAKIATKVDQVVDVFYVRDFNGQKVHLPDQVALIEQTILSVLQHAVESENQWPSEMAACGDNVTYETGGNQ
ncbi:MAG: [protein-PII] uridylyltransferase [Desulfobacterales bacterium]|jgi:[protein-PII] uridylyltransferase|nr:[protein-PII] uridylyltransferase [Desulfobacterales bacterium]